MIWDPMANRWDEGPFYNGTSFHKFSAAPDKRFYVNCVFSPAVSRHGRYYIMGFCGCISASGRTRTFQDQFGAFVFSSRNPVCPVKQGRLEGLWRAGRVHGIMLAAEVHLSAVAVHNVHTLFDIQAPGSQVRAIRLVHRSAENGAAVDPGIGD